MDLHTYTQYIVVVKSTEYGNFKLEQYLICLTLLLIIACYCSEYRVASPTCYTYPGMIYQQNGLGQYMAIQGGVNGCLSNVRQVMRLLMSLLGQRSEYNKPNRNAFVSVNTGIATSGKKQLLFL